MNGAVLAISARPYLLDRRGQPGRAVGDDQAWRGESAGSEVAAELEPVLAIGAAAVGLGGQEGHIFRRVIGWSLLLVLLMCVLVLLQSTSVLSWMVP